MMAHENTVEVQYWCPTCQINFYVYHTSDLRNTHCCYCGTEVKLTGQVSKLEGEEIVTYQDGKEVERREKCR